MANRLTIPETINLFRSYHSKPMNGSWGSLHIVLEDGNVKNADVEYCLQYAKDNDDIEGEKLANILLRMSKTQRLKIGMII